MKTQKSQKGIDARHNSQWKSLHNKEKKRAAKVRKQLNENWKRMEQSRRYMSAVNEAVVVSVGRAIETECMDGIFIHLKARNEKKSNANKRRILRRIVEKRQAQAVTRRYSKDKTCHTTSIIISNTSRCMAHLERLRHAS